MGKKFAKLRANCCGLFHISTLWNCRTRRFAAVRREPTTLPRPKRRSSYSPRKCATPSRPGLRSLPLPTLAVSCNCAPELPSTERTKTSCTLLSYLTALSRHTRILLRDSAIDRLASPLPNQIAAALWPHPCRVYRSGGDIATASPAPSHPAALLRPTPTPAPTLSAPAWFRATLL